jgi:hypothetical protein
LAFGDPGDPGQKGANGRWRAWARETGETEGEENEDVATELQSAFDEVAADEDRKRMKNRSRCKGLMKNISRQGKQPRGIDVNRRAKGRAAAKMMERTHHV